LKQYKPRGFGPGVLLYLDLAFARSEGCPVLPIEANPLYDLVLENGVYRVGVHLSEPLSKEFHGKPIIHRLPIVGLYKTPWLGTLLRNFWAKRKGAVLFQLPPG